MAILNTPNGTVIGMIPEELLNGGSPGTPVAPKKRTRKKAAEQPEVEQTEEQPE